MTHQRSSNLRLLAMVFALVTGLATVLGAVLSAAQAAPVGKLTQFRVPTDNSQPRHITVGSDGNLWFTEGNEIFTPNPDDPDAPGTTHRNIGKITPSGEVTEFRIDSRDGESPLPNQCDCLLNDIVQGPSGILYFTTNNPGLGRITTGGDVLAFVAPNNNLANGGGIAARDNAIWYTDFNNDSLWRYDVPSEQFTEFPVPTPGTDPLDVAVASDGKVWFSGGDAIGSLDPSTNEVRQFATLTPNAGPLDIAAAPTGGSVWFTQTLTGNVARATPAGVITEGKAVRNSDPFGITIGPGDNPWYTMSSANKIARLTLN